MKYKRYIFPILMGSTMSVIMSQINTGKIIIPSVITMMLLQSMVASFASLIFPAGIIGAKLTKKLYRGKSYNIFLIISSILPAIYFTAIMSISGLLKMKGYDENFWKMYFSTFPMNVLCGYLASIFWNVILDKTLIGKEI
ncbi:MAG: hypothetical protein E7K81_03155 [Finegoldia magna]|uniref:hypothetical protein n=1 Tax=Finegoldia magna TaxID=1260 RepID=UPI0029086D2A|nr:hypothetical protein [Finegoldia magna]MDU7478666.1 hypothetical protein [Finegoldia magna]